MGWRHLRAGNGLLFWHEPVLYVNFMTGNAHFPLTVVYPLLCVRRKEMRLLQKELEVLSDQHTHKCLENSQLYQELQDERQALAECQRENQELKEKQVQTICVTPPTQNSCQPNQKAS